MLLTELQAAGIQLVSDTCMAGSILYALEFIELWCARRKKFWSA